jgi:hypothetical protein
MHEVIQDWLKVLFNKSRSVARKMDLSDGLKKAMVKNFKEYTREENGQKIFVCDKRTLMEFYSQGLEILKYLQDHSDKFFDPLEWHLEGVEVLLDPIVKGEVRFRGFCDIILRHKLTGAVKIIDLKTSTKGWNKWAKRDKTKTNQLLVYKHYYAKQFDLPIDAIAVEFLILKRTLYENCDFEQPRVSKFIPASARISMNKAIRSFQMFLNECYNDDATYNTNNSYEATPSKSACRFCPFNNTEHCDQGVWKE